MEKPLPHDHGDTSRRLVGSLPTQTAFEATADLMKRMSDGARLRIFWLLCHCEECVYNIAALLNLSSATVSHHLKSLKEGGLIESRRQGREVHYRAADTLRAHILHEMIEKIVEISCPVETPWEEREEESLIRTVNQIHTLLTEDLSRRYTIEELSHLFHINPTTLKSRFKAVFGSPIGTYMKEYRIRQAQRLLRQRDLSIGQIASAVGYENQSKFTAAFQSVTGILPKQYRSEHTKNKKGEKR